MKHNSFLTLSASDTLPRDVLCFMQSSACWQLLVELSLYKVLLQLSPHVSSALESTSKFAVEVLRRRFLKDSVNI